MATEPHSIVFNVENKRPDWSHPFAMAGWQTTGLACCGQALWRLRLHNRMLRGFGPTDTRRTWRKSDKYKCKPSESIFVQPAAFEILGTINGSAISLRFRYWAKNQRVINWFMWINLFVSTPICHFAALQLSSLANEFRGGAIRTSNHSDNLFQIRLSALVVYTADNTQITNAAWATKTKHNLIKSMFRECVVGTISKNPCSFNHLFSMLSVS